MGATIDLTVRDAPDRDRYEATTGDGRLAAIGAYRRQDDRLVFTHTETVPEFEGEGVASTLVREALTDARSRGLQVVPRCPYVRAWIERHPDFADLVAPA